MIKFDNGRNSFNWQKRLERRMNLEVWAEVSAWLTAAPTSPSLWFALVGLTVAYWVTDIHQLFGWIDAVSENAELRSSARIPDERGGDCR